MPAVTISAPPSAPHALDNPYGMAFDRGGNLWVVGNSAGKVYEYAKWQLARSGSPTPRTTISDFPGTPLGDGFDASGDLWVTIQLSTTCPQGCVVEFPRPAGHDEPDADGHDLFDRRRQHCLLAFRGHVDGHWRRVGLLRHPL